MRITITHEHTHDEKPRSVAQDFGLTTERGEEICEMISNNIDSHPLNEEDAECPISRAWSMLDGLDLNNGQEIAFACFTVGTTLGGMFHEHEEDHQQRIMDIAVHMAEKILKDMGVPAKVDLVTIPKNSEVNRQDVVNSYDGQGKPKLKVEG